MAHVGRSSWNGREAPHASSTIRCFPRRWQISAMRSISADVPYGVGLTISGAEASGYRSQVASTSSGDGELARCSLGAHRGLILRGWIPASINPASADLYASREI